jgi:hypothetical protein
MVYSIISKRWKIYSKEKILENKEIKINKSTIIDG